MPNAKINAPSNTFPSIALPSPYTMRSWDSQTLALGVPELVLIENAAQKALTILKQEQELAQKTIFVFMGAGNNGADALCLARHLMDLQTHVTVIHTRNLKNYKTSAQKLIKLAKSLNLTLISANRFLSNWQNMPLPDIIVDGILGTGFSSNLGELESKLIDWINKFQAKAYVLALDVPSGMNSQTGAVQDKAVFANSTICFEAAKPGLIFEQARAYTGKIFVRSIGIPKQIQKEQAANFELLSPQFPLSCNFKHKGEAGHVLVFGACKGLEGAANLAALGALRQGAGLASLALPLALFTAANSKIHEVMTKELKGAENFVSPEAVQKFDFSPYGSVVLGTGWGKNPESLAAIEAYLNLNSRPATVFDADALNLLAQKPELLSKMTANDVLTPHPKEAAKLLGSTVQKISESRVNALAKLVKLCPANIVLKGVNTLIAKGNSPICISPANVPALAVGGSGDVLSGIIAALLVAYSSQYPTLSIVKQGVFQHISAGLYLSQTYPKRGNLASEIAEALLFANKVQYLESFNLDYQN